MSLKRRILIKGIAAMPFISGMAAASAAGSIFRPAEYLTDEARSQLKNLKGSLPKGKLGKFEISRIIIGCNPIGGFSHARDLRYVGTLSKRWHTPQKTKETWAIAEAAGINTAALISSQYPVFNEYKKETGSKMINICQCYIGRQPDDRLDPLRSVVDLGADIIYIQGEVADNLYRTNALDVLFQAMEYTHNQGLLFGVGAHSIQTILKSIDLGVKPDFYFKTFHHDNYWSASPRDSRKEPEPLPPPAMAPSQAQAVDQSSPAGQQPNPQIVTIPAGSPDAFRVDHDAVNDNIWDLFPEQTIEAFRRIDVPMVGFKTMAAGAITPADGFRWAFENGADFICAGIYDFQMVDDINAATDVLGSLGKRQRPWYS